MDKLDDMKWRVGLTTVPLSIVVFAGVLYLLFHYMPELVSSGDRFSVLAIYTVVIFGVTIIKYATTRFWAWKLNDYSYYNSIYSGFTRWTCYSLAVVLIGFVILAALEMPNLRNEALFNSVWPPDTAMARRMLDKGADPNYCKYRTPVIFESLSQKNKEIFWMLLDHGVNLQARNSSGITILTHTLAIGPSYDHLTQQLLKHGAKPDFLERADVEGNYNKYLHRQTKRAAKR